MDLASTVPYPVRLGRKAFFRAAFFCCMLGVSAASQATVLTATDATWRVTPNAPATPDWNSNVAFDDSTWQFATELYNVTGYVAKGIWSSGGQFSQSETQIWARIVFNLGMLPLSALLTNGFDDDGDIYVNGVQVVSDHDGGANNTYTDITSYLVLGNNLIAYTASDNFPVWGFNHASWLQVDAQFAQVTEPISLGLFGLGLGALVFTRRRAQS